MDDARHSEPPRGLFDSLRALIDRVVAIVQNRAELFTTELQEEASRLVGALAWAFVAILATIVAATFAGFTLVLFIPPQYRPWTAAGVALLFLAVAGIGLVSVRRIARAKPRPFDASLNELKKDRDHLRGRP